MLLEVEALVGLKLVVDTRVGNDRPREIAYGEPLRQPQCAPTCTSPASSSAGKHDARERQVGARSPKARYLIVAGASTILGLPTMTRSSRRRRSATASNRSSTPACPAGGARPRDLAGDLAHAFHRLHTGPRLA